MKKCAVIVFLFCFSMNSYALDSPKQTKSFFFGSPWYLFDYVGKEDINIKSLGKALVGYSKKGGFIDTTHMGDSFKWTVYYQKELYKTIQSRTKKITLEIVESVYDISLEYGKLSSQEEKEFSIELAGYLAYYWSVYHEMLSWYNYKSTGLFSEFGSAFSPEDLYSDLLGTIIAKEALKSNDFEKASFAYLDFWMERLNLQPLDVVKKAHKSVIEKSWWNGKSYPFNKVYKRNFDIGFDNGTITPFLLKEFSQDANAIELSVPLIPNKDNFQINIRIKPKEKQGKILLDLAKQKEYLIIERDFLIIMKEIEKDAVEKLKYE